MAKSLRFGKFRKQKSADKEDQYVWNLKQFGKLSGARSRELKAQLDAVVANFLKPDAL